MWTLSDFDNTRWVEKSLKAFYVSKHGDDRNDGHPRRPVASINRGAQLAIAANQTTIVSGISYRPVIVSSGVYSEVASLEQVILIGDGFVTLDGSGAGSLSTATGTSTHLQDLTVQNYGQIIPAECTVSITRCVVRNVGTIGSGGYTAQNYVFKEVLFVNAPLHPIRVGPYSDQVQFDQCTLINSNFRISWYTAAGRLVFRNSYMDANSKLGEPLRGSQDVTFSIYNSNVEGMIRDLRLAEYIDAGNLAVDCVSTAPGFNNPAASDYTLAATSQMRNLSFEGGYLGAYGVGINFSGLADADTLVNTQWSSSMGAFILSNTNEKGTVEFVVKDFQRNWILKEALLVGQEDDIDRQTIDATLSYDVDGFGAPANVSSGALEMGRTYWVTDYDSVSYNGQLYTSGQFFHCNGSTTYTATGAGKVVKLIEAPNIRLYELKYSTTSAVACVSQPWRYFVFNKVPTVDASGRSNGDPLHDPNTANPVTVRYMKLRLTIMPNSLA
jgi:hypothetical protein